MYKTTQNSLNNIFLISFFKNKLIPQEIIVTKIKKEIIPKLWRRKSEIILPYIPKKFFILELNTQPGMTKLSLVPEIASYEGISFLKLIEWILKDASKKK